MNIRTKAIGLLEKQITKTAQVLESRAWNEGTFYEIDLHFPGTALKWDKGVQYINCRVAPLTFREYTIAQWDAETRTCTLYIDAAHNGRGSNWVKSLQRGDTISYLNVECRDTHAGSQQNCLCFGDQTAVGHFLALQQLVGNTAKLKGALLMGADSKCREFTSYFPALPLQALPAEQYCADVLLDWLKNHDTVADAIYLAGNTAMILDIRKQLKAAGYHARQIKAQAFWR